MSNQVNYYKDENGEWRWRVISSNGNILGDSGESYKNLADCKAGFNSLKVNAYTEVEPADE